MFRLAQSNIEFKLNTELQVVDLKPEWPKGYSRLGAANVGLGNWDDAVDAYKKGSPKFAPPSDIASRETSLDSKLYDTQNAVDRHYQEKAG